MLGHSWGDDGCTAFDAFDAVTTHTVAGGYTRPIHTPHKAHPLNTRVHGEAARLRNHTPAQPNLGTSWQLFLSCSNTQQGRNEALETCLGALSEPKQLLDRPRGSVICWRAKTKKKSRRSGAAELSVLTSAFGTVVMRELGPQIFSACPQQLTALYRV